jgi:hypothetical protein
MEQEPHSSISWVEQFDGRMQTNPIVAQLCMFLAKLNTVFSSISWGSNPATFVDHRSKVDLIPLTGGKIA